MLLDKRRIQECRPIHEEATMYGGIGGQRRSKNPSVFGFHAVEFLGLVVDSNKGILDHDNSITTMLLTGPQSLKFVSGRVLAMDLLISSASDARILEEYLTHRHNEDSEHAAQQDQEGDNRYPYQSMTPVSTEIENDGLSASIIKLEPISPIFTLPPLIIISKLFLNSTPGMSFRS
ncbi:hypothetical protein BZG36_04909, partial [Bifiguratus adelaidae]